MSEKLRVGLVGTGIGKSHADAYRSLPDQFELVAVCAAHLEHSRAFADTYHVPSVCADLAEMCQRDDLDVIDLATPPYLHLEQVLAALDAGKHVIVEKPLVGSLKDTDEIIRAAQRAGKQVMPIFNYRFGQGIQKLKRLVDAGVAGQAYLTTVETAWRRREEY